MFYDEKGVAHDTLQARDNADREYEAARRHTEDLRRNNLTRYDIFIGGVLVFATVVFFMKPFLDVIQKGQGIWFAIKYFAILAVLWPVWIYSLRFTVNQRELFWPLFALVCIAIGVYINKAF